jgi:hypothetical protein
MTTKVAFSPVIVLFGLLAWNARGDQPKSYSFNLRTESKIGEVNLQPGDYRLLVHNHDPKLLVRDRKGNEIEVNGKIDDVGAKFQSTMVFTNHDGGTAKIMEIRLGGSTMKVTFD